MSDERDFGELLSELERVGIDPSSFPAGVDITRDAALRILRTLPADIGPTAFLTALREENKRFSGPQSRVPRNP
jgi:hypothetical protein